MGDLWVPPSSGSDPDPEPEQPTVDGTPYFDASDLYDHELIALRKVGERLAEYGGQRRDMEGFRQEVIDRYAKIGFVVRCNVYETDQPGVYIPEVELVGRVEAHEFDHDRQVHEVTHGLLTDEPGIVTESGRLKEPPKQVGFSSPSSN
jgi:hypothetical protein